MIVIYSAIWQIGGNGMAFYIFLLLLFGGGSAIYSLIVRLLNDRQKKLEHERRMQLLDKAETVVQCLAADREVGTLLLTALARELNLEVLNDGAEVTTRALPKRSKRPALLPKSE